MAKSRKAHVLSYHQVVLLIVAAALLALFLVLANRNVGLSSQTSVLQSNQSFRATRGIAPEPFRGAGISPLPFRKIAPDPFRPRGIAPDPFRNR